MKMKTLTLAATLLACAAPAFAGPSVARDALTQWLAANKREALAKTDCKAGSSTDGVEFKLSCQDKSRPMESTIFEAKELGDDYCTMMLSDGQGTIRTVVVYLPALEAKFAQEVKAAAGVVFVGRAGVETRAELQSRGALLNDEDVRQAAIAAQEKVGRQTFWRGLIENYAKVDQGVSGLP